MDMDKLRRLASLKRQYRAHTADATDLKKEIGPLEKECLEMLGAEGCQRIDVDGTLLYIRRDVFPERPDGVSTQDVAQALIDAGHPELVQRMTYNSNTIRSWMSEYDRDGDPLPPELEGKLRVGERYSIGATNP